LKLNAPSEFAQVLYTGDGDGSSMGKDAKRKEHSLTGFPPGSLIWIKCESSDDVAEMTEAIEKMDLDGMVFIVTGPAHTLMQVDQKLLSEALRTVKLFNDMKPQRPN
jgi:hypothetical protein